MKEGERERERGRKRDRERERGGGIEREYIHEIASTIVTIKKADKISRMCTH